MVPVADYLKKLLYQYDCIVVPELGGFLLHDVPATYVENSSLFFPPRKKIAFNASLKLDDGLLVSYMMLHDQRSREEVLQHIRSFVDTLKGQIRQAGSYTIEGIGLFSENEEGKLQFDPELRHNFQGESYGLQPVSVRLQPVTHVDEESTPIIPIGEPAAPGQPSTVHPEKKAAIYQPYLTWAATILLVGSLGVMSYLTVQRSPGQATSNLNPFDFLLTRQAEAPAPEEKPVILPTPTEEVKPAPVAEVAQPVTAPVAAVKPAEAPAPEIAVAPKTIQEVEPIRYIAIAGSFSSKANAKKLLRQLRRQGFKTAFIIPKKKKGDLIKVAAFGSTDRNETLATLDKVSQTSRGQAWIYKQ
jgi:hypothetical protein